MLPLLQLAAEANGQEVSLPAAVVKLADKFNLSDDERQELLPSGGTFKFSSRVSWARTYLQKAGLLEATRRGHFRITDRGQRILKSKPDHIDGELLSQFEEFREFQGKKRDPRTDKTSELPLSAETPIESLGIQHERLREALASELLERVKKCSPQFFERLVILLLVRMGYGGSLKDAGQAVGKTKDGGIDGVIRALLPPQSCGGSPAQLLCRTMLKLASYLDTEKDSRTFGRARRLSGTGVCERMAGEAGTRHTEASGACSLWRARRLHCSSR